MTLAIIECLLGVIIQNIIAQVVTKSERQKEESAKTVIIAALVGTILMFLAI